MELKDIINKAKKENCIVVKNKHDHYNIICEFIGINNITFNGENNFDVHQINDTIYFGSFWIDKDDIETIDFTGRKDYNIL